MLETVERMKRWGAWPSMEDTSLDLMQDNQGKVGLSTGKTRSSSKRLVNVQTLIDCVQASAVPMLWDNGHSLQLQHFFSHMGQCKVKLTNNVTNLICPDCDGCSEECDHRDHGIRLRQDSISDHMARTGHRRCRAAREIKPEMD